MILSLMGSFSASWLLGYIFKDLFRFRSTMAATPPQMEARPAEKTDGILNSKP
jgi:hypothetical protein